MNDRRDAQALRARSRSGKPPVPRPSIAEDDLLGPANGWFVWLTVVGFWLLSLLPWRAWPSSPDLLLLALAFWAVHEPRRVGMLAAFVFGLLMDVHDTMLLGQHALSYVLVVYGAQALHRRLQRFDLLRQALHMLPIFVGATLLSLLVSAWLMGSWPGWVWLQGTVLTAVFWPVLGWVLLLPQRRIDDTDGTAR